MTNRFREEEAIRRAQLGSGRRSFVHRQLLPQGKVLDRELAVAAEEEREESKHVEQEGDHRAEILSGSAPIDQQLAAGRGFGEGQVKGRADERRGHRSELADHRLYFTTQRTRTAVAARLAARVRWPARS